MKTLKLNFILLLLVVIGNLSYSQTVQIGSQTWTSKNLNVDTFRNGDTIPQAKTIEEWNSFDHERKAAWCYYDNKLKNGKKYGKLYNWYAVNDLRGIAPSGYHVPSDEEWVKLLTHLGGEKKAGAKLKYKAKENKNYKDSISFSGQLGGYRNYLNEPWFCCVFHDIGKYTYWWSSSEEGEKGAWSYGLSYYDDIIWRYCNGKQVGLYVRCIKD